MSEGSTRSERMAAYDAESGPDEGPHPVCVVHLAFIPCRHGRGYSPCARSEDEEAQKVVSRFHAGEMSRWEALDTLSGLGAAIARCESGADLDESHQHASR